MASAVLSTLYRADGSATYKSNGSSVIASVNGPIEVQRRDELPEEAAIDVAARPATGVGGKKSCKVGCGIDSHLHQGSENGTLKLLSRTPFAELYWSQLTHARSFNSPYKLLRHWIMALFLVIYH